MNVSQPCAGAPTTTAPTGSDGLRPFSGDQDRPSKVLTQKSVRATTTWVGPVALMFTWTVRYSIPAGGRGARPPYAHGRSRPVTVISTMVSPVIGDPLELPVTSAPGGTTPPGPTTPTSATTTGSFPG